MSDKFPISFRAADRVEELAKRGVPSLAAKFATRRYLALMRTYRSEVHAQFSPSERDFLYARVLPNVSLSQDDPFELIHAYAEKYGATESLAQKLRKASLVVIDALVDEYRQLPAGWKPAIQPVIGLPEEKETKDVVSGHGDGVCAQRIADPGTCGGIDILRSDAP